MHTHLNNRFLCEYVLILIDNLEWQQLHFSVCLMSLMSCTVATLVCNGQFSWPNKWIVNIISYCFYIMSSFVNCSCTGLPSAVQWQKQWMETASLHKMHFSKFELLDYQIRDLEHAISSAQLHVCVTLDIKTESVIETEDYAIWPYTLRNSKSMSTVQWSAEGALVWNSITGSEFDVWSLSMLQTKCSLKIISQCDIFIT